MLRALLLTLLLRTITNQPQNDIETENSIIIEDVEDSPPPEPIQDEPASDSKESAEKERLQLVMDGLYCFNTVQQFFHNNPDTAKRFSKNGPDAKFAAKVMVKLFGHCKTQHEQMSMEDQLKLLHQGQMSSDELSALFGNVDLESVVGSAQPTFDSRERELLRQFNEVANEVHKNREGSKKGPDVNVAGIKVDEMGSMTVVVPVVLIVGFILFAWKKLFASEEGTGKKKKKKGKSK